MLTNKGKYGLKAMVHLAGLEPGKPALVADIAAANDIPKKFLDAILGELRTAGLVHSKKGRGGGYALARAPTPSASAKSSARSTACWRRSAAPAAPSIGAATIARATGEVRRADRHGAGARRDLLGARRAHPRRVARTRRTRRVSAEESRRADLELFVGRNRARLLAHYDALGRGAWPFCWPGLLAPQAWFLYRKMYLWAALVSAGPLVIAYLPGWTASRPGALR